MKLTIIKDPKLIDLKKNMAVRLPYKVKLVNGYCDIITNYEGEILLLDSEKYYSTTKKGEWHRPFAKAK